MPLIFFGGVVKQIKFAKNNLVRLSWFRVSVLPRFYGAV